MLFALAAGRSRSRSLAVLAAAALAAVDQAAAQRAENGAIALSARSAGDRALFTRAPNGSQLRLVTTFGRADRASFSPRG